MSDITTTQASAPVLSSGGSGFDLSPRTLDDALRLADYLADSTIVPKDFMGKPGNVLVAIQWGMEIGLKPLQAMQNIAVINGRPSLWGDAVIALVRASPLCEYVNETTDGDTAICAVKRRGEAEQTRTFSDADAKAAGLLGKTGPWSQYKARMRQMRARAFALRDVFPDVLKGMPIAEEVMDAPQERDITPRTAAEFAEHAKPKPAVEIDRNAVIRDLEMIARSNDAPSKRVADLTFAWKEIGKDKRAAVGRNEISRIEALAAAEEAKTNTSSEKAQAEPGTPAQGAVSVAPASTETSDDNPFDGVEA